MTPADRYLLNRLQEAIDILYLAGPHARASTNAMASEMVQLAEGTLQILANELQADPEDEEEDDDGTPVELKPEHGNPVAVDAA